MLNEPTKKIELAPSTVTAHPGPLPGTEPGAGLFKPPKFRFAKIGKIIGGVQLGLIVMGLALALTGFLDEPNTVSIGDSTFKVQVADSNQERVQGLSNTAALAQNEGMLFIFEQENYWPIWMKGMAYPIDIVWLNKDKQVVSVDHNVSPNTYPDLFRPEEPALYALEVAAGRAGNIKRGQTASFTELRTAP